jgi:hypothetical protein
MAAEIVTLGTIIAWVESKGDPHAIRFEPNVEARIHKNIFKDKIVANIRAIHKCTFETACVIYSSSFGKYQIMGDVIYDPEFVNFSDDIFAFCNDDAAQDKAFSLFTHYKNIAFEPSELLTVDNRLKFAIRYNGSPGYAHNIEDALKHFNIN